MAIRELGAENFDATLASTAIVAVHVWADCRASRDLNRSIDHAARRWPDVVFARLDADRQPTVRRQFDLQGIPSLLIFRETLLVYNDGTVLERDGLENLIGAVRSLDMDEVRRLIAVEERLRAARG